VTARGRGLALAAIHLALVLTLGGKYLLDRWTRPRVWVRTAQIDPYALFRGRYLQLALEVEGSGLTEGQAVVLHVEDGHLRAVPVQRETHTHVRTGSAGGRQTTLLREPAAFFIPDEAQDPTRLHRDLWAEVTVPSLGVPRPIQLGVERDGKMVPLDELPPEPN
jgi:GDYXXLXY protein